MKKTGTKESAFNNKVKNLIKKHKEFSDKEEYEILDYGLREDSTWLFIAERTHHDNWICFQKWSYYIEEEIEDSHDVMIISLEELNKIKEWLE